MLCLYRMDDRRRGLEHAGILFSHSLMCLTDLLQLQLPTGATLLGVILSSDKTTITSLCGGRVAHPLLVSLANIKMSMRLKLSSSLFMLTALLPIPKFTHKNKRMCGVLEDRLIHQCLDIVLEPLKKAAQYGITLPDPDGQM
jgi:hypothetical protein